MGKPHRKGRFGFVGYTCGSSSACATFPPGTARAVKSLRGFQSTLICPHNINPWALETIGPNEVVCTGTGLVSLAWRLVELEDPYFFRVLTPPHSRCADCRPPPPRPRPFPPIASTPSLSLLFVFCPPVRLSEPTTAWRGRGRGGEGWGSAAAPWLRPGLCPASVPSAGWSGAPGGTGGTQGLSSSRGTPLVQPLSPGSWYWYLGWSSGSI